LAASSRVASLASARRFLNGTLMRKPPSSLSVVWSASDCVHAVAAWRTAFFGLCLYASHISPAKKPLVHASPVVSDHVPSVEGAPLPRVLIGYRFVSSPMSSRVSEICCSANAKA